MVKVRIHKLQHSAVLPCDSIRVRIRVFWVSFSFLAIFVRETISYNQLVYVGHGIITRNSAKVLRLSAMGKLSSYARNVIVSLRSSDLKIERIKDLLEEEGIKTSRSAVSIFLSRYGQSGQLSVAARSCPQAHEIFSQQLNAYDHAVRMYPVELLRQPRVQIPVKLSANS